MTQSLKLLLITTLILTTMVVAELTPERKAELQKELKEAEKVLETKKAALAKVKTEVDKDPEVKNRIDEILNSLKPHEEERTKLIKEQKDLKVDEDKKKSAQDKEKEALDADNVKLDLANVERLKAALVFAGNADVKALAKTFEPTYDQDSAITTATQNLDKDNLATKLKTLQGQLKTLQDATPALETALNSAVANKADKQKAYDEAVAKEPKLRRNLEETELEKAKKALDAAVAEEETALDNLEANKDAINKKEIEINTLQAKISSIVTHSKDEVKIILDKIFTLYGVNQYSTWEAAYIARKNALSKNIKLLTEVNTRVVNVSNEDASVKQRERYLKENKDSTKTSDLEAKVAEVKRNKEKAENDLTLAKEAVENHKAVLKDTDDKLITATAAWKTAQTLSSVIKEEAKKDLVEKVTTALKPLGEGNENETKETVAHLELKEKEQNAERLYDIAHGKWGDKDIELETINTLIDEAWTPNDKTKAKADLIKQYQVAYNEELAAQATVTELETELNEGESSSNVWWWTIGSILVIAILGAVGFFIYKKKFSSVDVSSDSKNRQLAELA